MESLTRENTPDLLGVFMNENKLTTKKIAKVIGCPDMTLIRVLLRKTLPSDEMIKQLGLMMQIGYKKYSKLTDAEKEKLSDAIGAIGGGALGFASITAAISVLGTAGLSAAGISSGLAALGAIVGGGMVAGISVAAALPLAAGAAGYGIIKLVKNAAGEVKVNMKDIDLKWEIIIESDEVEVDYERE